MAFAVISNTWFVILWTRANPEHEGRAVALVEQPLWLLLGAAAMVGVGLFAFGVSLNDILDMKRDRLLRPQRPLASGQMSLEQAVALLVGTMIVAILGATVFGTRAVLMTLALQAGILVFNAVGKFIPAIGLVFLGLIYGGHMLIPNLHLRFLWPVWLVMTHALVVGAITYRMARKVPKLSRRAVIAAVVGWLFWSSVLLYRQWKHAEGLAIWPDWVDPIAAVWPASLLALFIVVIWRRTAKLGSGPRAAEKIEKYGALWLSFYACGWLVGTGHAGSAALMLGLAVASVVGMTVLREAFGLLEQPLGYRR
jgi:4-hydroxybenzoate polyprenyltransferase